MGVNSNTELEQVTSTVGIATLGLNKRKPVHQHSKVEGRPVKKRSRGSRCRHENCDKMAKTGGMCIAHGGGRRCSVPGCDKSDQGRRLCKAHGGGSRCKTPGCDKSDVGGGLCTAHGGGNRCKITNCTKSDQGGGFCKAHGGGRRCQHASCSKSDAGGGFCRKHGGGKRCQQQGCYKADVGSGYCTKHGKVHNSQIFGTAAVSAAMAANVASSSCNLLGSSTWKQPSILFNQHQVTPLGGYQDSFSHLSSLYAATMALQCRQQQSLLPQSNSSLLSPKTLTASTFSGLGLPLANASRPASPGATSINSSSSNASASAPGGLSDQEFDGSTSPVTFPSTWSTPIMSRYNIGGNNSSAFYQLYQNTQFVRNQQQLKYLNKRQQDWQHLVTTNAV